LPSAAAVQRGCAREGTLVIASAFFIVVVLYEATLCLILLLFSSQCTPLHFSAEKGHLETCRLLLQCNANLEAKEQK
jgi:hypothetical protein